MNCIKYSFIGLLLLCSASCNQERIDELEAEVWKFIVLPNFRPAERGFKTKISRQCEPDSSLG